MQTSIRKIGNSSGTIIPASVLKKLNLKTGDKINFKVANNQIVITKTESVDSEHLGSSWDSFFLLKDSATDDFLLERASQTQSKRESL